MNSRIQVNISWRGAGLLLRKIDMQKQKKRYYIQSNADMPRLQAAIAAYMAPMSGLSYPEFFKKLVKFLSEMEARTSRGDTLRLPVSPTVDATFDAYIEPAQKLRVVFSTRRLYLGYLKNAPVVV